MTLGEWGRIIAAALAGLAGLALARERAVFLTTEQAGVLLFGAAVAYAWRVIARHFDRRERDEG